jgi:hypothetical protein
MVLSTTTARRAVRWAVIRPEEFIEQRFHRFEIDDTHERDMTTSASVPSASI